MFEYTEDEKGTEKISEEITEEKKSEEITEEKKKDNIIFVGNKPLVNYVRGIITQFIRHNANEVIVKSRGKFISKAVDAAEVAKRSLQEKNVKIKDIQIGSESFETEGKRTNISTMDIVLIADSL